MEPLSFILFYNNQNIITNKYAWNMSIKYQMFNHINIYFLDTILTLGISQTPYTCMLLVGHMRWLLWTFFVGIGQCSHMWRLSRQTPLYWGSWTLWSSPLGLYLGMIILPAGTGPCSDQSRLGREWRTMFRDEDKILSPKVGGEGMGTGKHSPPRPRPRPRYIYIYIILFLNIFCWNK